MMEIHAQNASRRIIPDAYTKKNKLAEKIDTLKIRKNEILEIQYINEQIKQRLNEINRVIYERKSNK